MATYKFVGTKKATAKVMESVVVEAPTFKEAFVLAKRKLTGSVVFAATLLSLGGAPIEVSMKLPEEK